MVKYFLPFRTSSMANYSTKLIVVSNRLPFVVKKDEQGQWIRTSSAGGLVTAVAPVVVNGGGYWVGWPGKNFQPNDVVPDPDPNDTTPTAGLLSNKIIPISLNDELFDSYYNGCCNATFWPLLHSMPGRTAFNAKNWAAYDTVNKMFADETVKKLKTISNDIDKNEEPPIVWVHDYHLTLVPNYIRTGAEGLRYKLSFFLHIPFPSWDIFRLFPWADELLQGVLASDMVGFHTEDYCLNFIDCCQKSLGVDVDVKNLLVEFGGRIVKIRVLPVGIPYARFVSLAEKAPQVLTTKQKVVLCVDRLDYTKGLTYRLQAFQLFLKTHPEYIGKVTLLQIAVPTRPDVKEYKDLKEEMEKLVGQINGEFTTPNWSPIRYIYGTVPQNELAAFYRDASVALVTPLRDGMNLVAKEFVACQIKSPPGVLILSPFAGASVTMKEALTCNVYEFEQFARVIYTGLEMPEDEKILRMTLLQKREKLNDVQAWMTSFLKEMDNVVAADTGSPSYSTLNYSSQIYEHQLAKALIPHDKLILFLDYDGTLAPLAAHPDLAHLPEKTRLVLEKLSMMPNIIIAIVSGRSIDDLRKMIAIKNVTYAGSHGLNIIHTNGKTYNHPLPSGHSGALKQLYQALSEQVAKHGAWIEDKGAYLTFHYRETPVNLRGDLIDQATELMKKLGFIPVAAHSAVEAKPPVQWNKGRAAIHMLTSLFDLDWNQEIRVIFIGDDNTDEDAMKALKGIATTFRVTSTKIVRTAADYRLADTDSVYLLLKWIEENSIMASSAVKR